MAATDQQILDAAKDSLLRILNTDSSSWSESERSQQQHEIGRLQSLIDRFEAKTQAAAGRRIHRPVRRVGI